MDVAQVAFVGLAGTLLGAAIAGFVALAVTKLGNDHAERMAADERDHQDKVRKHTAGVQSAKDALGHLNRVRGVFDSFLEPDDPEQEWYESAYRAAVLAAVDIDDEAAAKTVTDIAEAYWASWLATELGEWTPRSLSYALYKLAHATVRAYTQDQPLPDRSELDKMLREIDGNWQQRVENEERDRAEQHAARKKAAARVKAEEPAKPVRRRTRTGTDAAVRRPI
jgi:hypothetical protein